MLKNYTFCRLHIPTAQQTSATVPAHSFAHFHSLLDRWNGQQPGLWQYWSAPGIEPAPTKPA